jgi:endonuclease/exonuclease/phosphatase family metal-dependent hydrolase
MISILTLNLWRYYDFEKRLPNILKAIQEKQPDVVFLQEVQIDLSKSPDSQMEILSKNFPEYKYCIHSTIYPKEFQQGVELDKPIQHGMAVLSKYPILKSFNFFVSKNPGEEEPRSILCLDIEKDSKVFKCANIHFANKEEWAKNQLSELLNFIHSREEKRILVGDFNLFKLSEYKMLKGYTLSFDYKSYVSYPKDNGSLDYVVIPDEFTFSKLDLIEDYLSDHKALFVEIK